MRPKLWGLFAVGLFSILGVAFGQVYPGDHSHFVEDVTLPDGSTVNRGELVVKQWRLQNNGTVAWHNRYITRLGNPKQGFKSEKWTELPETKPGDTCLVTVRLTAPNKPGRYKAEFKMVSLSNVKKQRGFITSAKEKILLPNQDPIYIDCVVK